MKKVTLTFPSIMSLVDYHEIDAVLEFLAQLGVEVKAKELGMAKRTSRSIFVLYIGTPPSDEQIAKMLADKKIELLESHTMRKLKDILNEKV